MKVIVADDEFFARKALVMMLEKMELPLEICGECENGQDVVELLEQDPVDLIITDIKMSEMDGLRLAEYVYERGWDTDIIIETGYADFDYAKLAIRYGVKEYLIKPLNEEELYESIRKVVQERQKRSRKVWFDLLDFSYILQNEEIRRQALDWGGKQEKDHYYMILANGKDRAQNDRFIREWLGRYGRFEEIRGFFFEAKNESIWLAFSEKELNLPEAFGRMAKAEVERSWPDKVWISFSTRHSGEKELEQAYRECIYGINGRILENERVFFFKAKTEFREIITREQEQQLSNAVERGDEKEAGKVIEEIFREAQEKEENIYSFFAALMRIFFILNQIFYQNKEENSSQESSAEYLLFDFKMDLYQFYNLGEVRQYVEMLVKEVCCKNTDKENTSMIENLLDYLERHYSRDISLRDLAERKYFVSSSYLSRLFKAYTGQNFMKYLIRLRMEKAREFLECSQMEISDIAACTGYNDPSHFTQTFRRFYGVSPKEYRKLKQKKP